jgi:hypothetical protein
MQRALLLITSMLAMNHVAAAAELKGKYAFTGSESCLYSTLGFSSEFGVVPGSTSWSESGAEEGIRTFDGKGGGTVSNRGMSITVPPTPGFFPGASSSESTFSATYQVMGNTWTTVDVPGTYNGEILTGGRAGQTFTLNNVPTRTGMISQDVKTLTLASLDPQVETISFSNGDSFQRICQRSRVFVKLD